jgi:hypothetical protein
MIKQMVQAVVNPGKIHKAGNADSELSARISFNNGASPIAQPTSAVRTEIRKIMDTSRLKDPVCKSVIREQLLGVRKNNKSPMSRGVVPASIEIRTAGKSHNQHHQQQHVIEFSSPDAKLIRKSHTQNNLGSNVKARRGQEATLPDELVQLGARTDRLLQSITGNQREANNWANETSREIDTSKLISSRSFQTKSRDLRLLTSRDGKGRENLQVSALEPRTNGFTPHGADVRIASQSTLRDLQLESGNGNLPEFFGMLHKITAKSRYKNADENSSIMQYCSPRQETEGCIQDTREPVTSRLLTARKDNKSHSRGPRTSREVWDAQRSLIRDNSESASLCSFKKNIAKVSALVGALT